MLEIAGADAMPADGPLDGSKIRVLLVDDSRLQRRILSGSLKKWGYEVSEAESGISALEICRHSPPDIVISDWMMPEMDGLTFCQKFRDMRRVNYGYFILLTSKSEKGEVAEGLDCGADDFLTKPVNQSELRARLSAGERIIRMEQKLQQQNHVIRETLSELTAIHQAMNRDLLQAREIQMGLLPEPETDFKNAQISQILQSCGHVGGDLVGHFDAGHNQVGFFNIDVSGHGITSALMTARIGGYLSSRFLDQNIALEKSLGRYFRLRTPSNVARLLNDRLSTDAGIDQYFTMAFATVNLNSGKVQIVQAGHPSPVVIPRTGPPKFIGAGGFPIGLIAGVEYHQIELTLNQGDRLLFYSDGFTEALLPDGSYLEESGLVELIEQSRELTGRAFLSALYQSLWRIMPDAYQLADDVSAIMLEYTGSKP